MIAGSYADIMLEVFRKKSRRNQREYKIIVIFFLDSLLFYLSRRSRARPT